MLRPNHFTQQYMQPFSEALYSVAQIRQAEQFAIQALQMPGLQLMHLAGLAAFNHLRQRWPDCCQLSVFCGAGNNAGDGYVIATLGLQAGFDIKVYSLVDVADLRGDALSAYREFIQDGGEVIVFNRHIRISGIVIDALLGTGLNRQVSAEYAVAIDLINQSACPVVSIDVPSGLHADTGCVMGCAVKAQLTVTFIGLKSGLYTGDASEYCGQIVCDTLNVPDSVLANLPPVAKLLKKTPLSPRPRHAHKGLFGHVLLIGGNHGYAGAIRLAGEAALRSGAGLVSIATRAVHTSLINIGRPELMCHAAENVTDLQALLAKASVMVIGPGIGQDEWAQAMLNAVLQIDKPCVVDADALNLLAKNPVFRDHWIMTPHPGEAARLLGCSNQNIAEDRYAAVRKLQSQYGGVCILKGSGSLVADTNHLYLSTTGNPGMASGGMGDVLSGVTGALLAQGLSTLEAAKLAVYVHGEAADQIAEISGERGLLASDLYPKIRELLN